MGREFRLMGRDLKSLPIKPPRKVRRNMAAVLPKPQQGTRDPKKAKFTVKIGFIPSNWESWDGGGWGGKMRDRCVAVLQQIPGLELVAPPKEMTGDGCVSTVEQAKEVLDYFKREDIKGILLGNMTFGHEVSAVGTLVNGLSPDLPILHFCTRSGPIDEEGHRSTDNWCGQFMTTSALKRRGRKFVHIHTCNPEDDYFKTSVETFARAVNAIARFRYAKFGQLGIRPQLFESQCYSETALQKHFGQMVVPMDLDAVFQRVEAVSPNDPEVKQVISEITEGVEMREITDESLVNMARYEVAVVRIAEELDVQALAANCWRGVQERFGISVCSSFGRLNDRGIITACESDLLGAVSMWAVYCAALGEHKPDFIDWTDLHPTEPNVWLAWHCGNAAPSLCNPNCRPKMYRNERMIQWNPNCYGAVEFLLRTGPVTCSRLVEYDGEFTMFFGTGEVVDIPPFVRGGYGWVKVNDVFDWEDKLVNYGIIHHGTLIHDPKVADALEMFCKFLDIQAVRGA
jgi:L-fucose isomerase-like protein